jgi:hypothetical protein
VNGVAASRSKFAAGRAISFEVLAARPTMASRRRRGRGWLRYFFLIKGDGVSARVGCISVVGGRESRWIEPQSGDLGGVVGTV